MQGCRGCTVQRCRVHECRGLGSPGLRDAEGAEDAGYRGAELMSAERSESTGVQGSGIHGCRGLRDARGVGHKGAGLRGAETTGV